MFWKKSERPKIDEYRLELLIRALEDNKLMRKSGPITEKYGYACRYIAEDKKCGVPEIECPDKGEDNLCLYSRLNPPEIRFHKRKGENYFDNWYERISKIFKPEINKK